jgi:molybdate transport system substrate-binding protein
MGRRPRRGVVAAVLAVGLALSACASGEADAPTSGDGVPALAGELRVLAAASLTEAFTELGRRFEADHPGLDVTFTFAASSALARQVNDGAPADVLVTADEASMAAVTAAGNAADPQTIARNRLAIVVGPGNPRRIDALADLGRRGVVFVVCAPEVPCGRFAAAALERAGVTATPASLEENVKAVVSRVTLDEADAGIVYVTDVRAAGDEVAGVDIDIADDPDLEAVYPAAITTGASNPQAAKAWIDHVRSAGGRRVLASHGFLAP